MSYTSEGLIQLGFEWEKDFAIYAVDGGDNKLVWKSGSPQPSVSDCETAHLVWESKEYARNRESVYASTGDQLDMQYWDSVNDTTTWKDHVASVKAQFPKGQIMALTKVTSGVRTLGTGEVVTANIADDDVTAAKMADDAVGVAQLSATGTASATTFLRGDNDWAEAGGGKCLQIQTGTLAGSSSATTTSTTMVDSGLEVAITPTAATSFILVWCYNGFLINNSSSCRVSWQILENAGSTVVSGPFQYRVDDYPFSDVFGGMGYFACSDTDERTFKVQLAMHVNSSSVYYKYQSGTTQRIIAMEIGA